MVGFHFCCFQSTAAWEESAKNFTSETTNIWKETFHSRVQLIAFEQKYVLDYLNQFCFVQP